MSPEPRATYRVQVHAGFTLDDAAEIVAYLDELGISHLYSSPYLQAAAGSQHGYDVVNHRRINPEVGGEAAHQKLAQALQKHGMSQVLDIVPNHMATMTENPWWWDVLENGPASRYATYFDVDWDPPTVRHSNQVLVPVLGDHYGRVLEAGELKLEYNAGRFCVRYYDNTYPIDPRTLSSLLASAAERTHSNTLVFLARALDQLPVDSDRTSVEQRAHDKEVLYALLQRLVQEQPQIGEALQAVVDEMNSDADALDVLLSLQNYRLAFWKMARRELGYRRFFDINTLIGLRMEDEQVYQAAHAKVLEWLQAGLLEGLRIDHPDGLRYPGQYFQRLRQAAPEAWIVVEKIVEPGEHMPEDWPVDGTTGYDFMYRVGNLLVDPQGEQPLTELYRRFTKQKSAYDDLVLRNKRMAANEVLGSDLAQLTARLVEVGENHRRYRDYGRNQLTKALVELAACLPVYRTYIDDQNGTVHHTDVAYLDQAVECAKANQPDMDPELFNYLCDLLLLRLPGEPEAEFAIRFQQFTGPVMAKGVEDTTFYQYYRLASLNEVGGSPGHFGLSVDEFHQAAQETQRHWARSMLSTSTHDSKRSEDVRARLHVLSEIPQAWAGAVERWSEMANAYRNPAGPDANDEYLLYQTLVGAWPIEAERVQQYMLKAVREAKRHTTWTQPNMAYEDALASFVQALLTDDDFCAEVTAFVNRLLLPGRLNSLSQTLIKLTAPGVPDIYQGTELWDLSLVDPDNRRPVDYARRRKLLSTLDERTPPEQVLAGMDNGLPKLWVIRQALGVRRRFPAVFGAQSGYSPIDASSPHAVAFQRGGYRGPAVITVAPRLTVGLDMGRGLAQAPGIVDLPPGEWTNILTHEKISGGRAALSDMWRRFPAALLVRTG